MPNPMSRFQVAGIVIVLAVLLGGVYLCSAQFQSLSPGEIKLDSYPSTQALEDDLLRRFPKGSEAAPLRAALARAGMEAWGESPLTSLQAHADRPLQYDRPTRQELFKKKRALSPDPHTVSIVLDKDQDRILDIVVTY